MLASESIQVLFTLFINPLLQMQLLTPVCVSKLEPAPRVEIKLFKAPVSCGG